MWATGSEENQSRLVVTRIEGLSMLILRSEKDVFLKITFLFTPMKMDNLNSMVALTNQTIVK